MLTPDRHASTAALYLLAIASASVSTQTPRSSTNTAVVSTAHSACPARSVNYITHSLQQQCLKTSWAGKSKTLESTTDAKESKSDLKDHYLSHSAGTSRTPSASRTAQAQTTQSASDPSSRPSELPLIISVTEASVPPTSTDVIKTPTTTSIDDHEVENDSPLDNTNFLSFEEWKIRNLAKVGQSAENLASRDGTAEPRRRPSTINNALDSLGEDAEIDIDFGGFAKTGIAKPAIPAKVRLEDGESAKSGEHIVEEGSSTRKRGKDAGKTCKERSNYASFDCAATVLKTNPECKGPTAVLVENKDSYMLNICSASNKYFIVELCDAILIDTIVLANFEFFSSMFRTFRVSVSDRYPVKLEKWKVLGTFETRNSREVQAFLVENPLIWARYLRVEFLTHFGNEYYCPVSLLRVHGTTMMEEFNHDLKRAGTEDEAENEAEESEEAESIDEVYGVVSVQVLKDVVQSTSSTEESVAQSSMIGLITTVDSPSNASNKLPPTLELGNTSYNSSLSRSIEDLLSSFKETEVVCLPKDSPANITSMQTLTPTVSQTSMSADTSISSSEAFAGHTPSVTLPVVRSETTETPHEASIPIVSNKHVNQYRSESAKTSNQTSVSAARIPTSSTQPSNANPTTQESFFKSVHKRLQLLESNSTLSLQYIEEQSRILRDAFSKVEKRQLGKTTTFLDALNNTVLTELREFRQQYDQIWQSTVLELSSQREQSQYEVLALSTRLGLLADEIVFQKRIAILQFILILLCLGLVLFTRHASSSSHLELPHILQTATNTSSVNPSRYAPLFDTPPTSPSSSRPTSRYGLFRSLTHRRSPSHESHLDPRRDGTKSPSIEYCPPTPNSQDSPGNQREALAGSESDNALSDGSLEPNPGSERQVRSSPATPSGKREEQRRLGDGEVNVGRG